MVENERISVRGFKEQKKKAENERILVRDFKNSGIPLNFEKAKHNHKIQITITTKKMK